MINWLKKEKYSILFSLLLLFVLGIILTKGYIYNFGDYTYIKNNENCIINSPNSEFVGGDKITADTIIKKPDERHFGFKRLDNPP